MATTDTLTKLKSMGEYEGIDPNSLVFIGEVGSNANGCNVEGQEDHDYIAVYVEDIRDLMLDTPRPLMCRTANEGTNAGGDYTKSKPGDVDLTIYTLRKFVQLVSVGNPNVLPVLFDTRSLLLDDRCFNREKLRACVNKKQAVMAFNGYMRSQLNRQTGEPVGSGKGRGKPRADLVSKYGYDTKFAYHAARLGHQGIEYATLGEIEQPVAEPLRAHLLDIRRGKVSLKQVSKECKNLARELESLANLSYEPFTTPWQTVAAEAHAVFCDMPITDKHWWRSVVMSKTKVPR